MFRRIEYLYDLDAYNDTNIELCWESIRIYDHGMPDIESKESGDPS